jgi:cytochrome c-type biogenesis protein CcmH
MSERLRNWTALAVIAASLAVIVTILSTAPPSDAHRVEALASRLKCPVCQSESINDSPAQLSRDLKQLIADRVSEGWTDAQIVDFFVATYGDEVLLDPPARGGTLLLWLLPILLAAAGIVVIVTRVRRSSRDLTDEERRRVADALREDAS